MMDAANAPAAEWVNEVPESPDAFLWSAVASEAGHRFGCASCGRRNQSAVVAALCRHISHGGNLKAHLNRALILACIRCRCLLH
jgi:hypothetical protein